MVFGSQKKIKMLENDKASLEKDIEKLLDGFKHKNEQYIQLKKDFESLEKRYNNVCDNKFTFDDVIEVLDHRLTFLDDKINEFEAHNVPVLAKHAFIKKQEIMDLLAIFYQINDNKEENKKKNIELIVREAMVENECSL